VVYDYGSANWFDRLWVRLWSLLRLQYFWGFVWFPSVVPCRRCGKGTHWWYAFGRTHKKCFLARLDEIYEAWRSSAKMDTWKGVIDVWPEED